MSMIPVVGHPVKQVTSGFEGGAVIGLLAYYALRDLVTSAQLDQTTRSRGTTGLFVCLSSAHDDDTVEQEDLDYEIDDGVLSAIGDLANQALAPFRLHTVRVGHAAALFGVQLAIDALTSGAIQRAVVIGADSLVGEDTLTWLTDCERLKSPDDAIGLSPGEASAALLIETEAACRSREGRALAVIGRPFQAHAKPLRPETLESDGRMLAECLEKAYGGRQGSVDIYADLNGEDWRAREWGMCTVRLKERKLLNSYRLVLPAIGLGDTGAASGAVSLCMAVRSFVRGYAQAPQAIVSSRSDNGELGAAMVEPM